MAPAYTGGNPGQRGWGPWGPQSRAGPMPMCPNWEPGPGSTRCRCPPGNCLISVQGVEEPSPGQGAEGNEVLGSLGLLSLGAGWCWADTSPPVPRICGAGRVFPLPPPNLCCPRTGGGDAASLQGMASPHSSSPSSSSVRSTRGRGELVSGANPHVEQEEHWALTGPPSRTTWVRPHRMKSRCPASSSESKSSCTPQNCCLLSPGGSWGHCPAWRGPGARRIPPHSAHMGHGAHRGATRGGSHCCRAPQEAAAPHGRRRHRIPGHRGAWPRTLRAAQRPRYFGSAPGWKATAKKNPSEIPPAAASLLPQL